MNKKTWLFAGLAAIVLLSAKASGQSSPTIKGILVPMVPVPSVSQTPSVPVKTANLGVSRAGAKPIAEGQLVRRFYPVADLVMLPELMKGYPLEKAENSVAKRSDQLIELITNTTGSGTWAKTGGPGSIDNLWDQRFLIVNQSPKVHDDIASLLTNLRKMYEVQVAVDFRLLAANEALLDPLYAKFGIQLKMTKSDTAEAGSGKGVAFLTKKQSTEFLKAFSQDNNAAVIGNSKITVLDSSTANFSEMRFNLTAAEAQRFDSVVSTLPQNKTLDIGKNFRITPVVSPDRKFVILNLTANLTTQTGADMALNPVQNPPAITTTSLRTTVKIPDGQTVLLVGMKTVTERREEQCIFFISDDPEKEQLALNAAFKLLPYPLLTRPILALALRQMKNVTFSRERLDFVIMVTPHILIAEGN